MKLDKRDSVTESGRAIAENLERMKALFPEAWTEGKIDFAVLRQLLGDNVDERLEKYGLNWFGRQRARAFAHAISRATLRPCSEESVDWEGTRNLVIEGDNLEVLKLLQASYQGKVKAVYIDPPYNTGKDFVYPDSYDHSVANYLEMTGQRDGGQRIASNPESNGRFHTNWLNMLYPRVLAAYNCLRDDGVLLVSIDEKEVANLRLLCSTVFGDECFVGTLVVLSNPKGRSQDKYFATNHEYVIVCSKRVLPKGAFAVAKDEEQVDAEYTEEDEIGRFRWHELRNTHREFGKHNRPNLFFPLYVSPDGEVSLESAPGCAKVLPVWGDGFDGCWTWSREKVSGNADRLGGRRVDGQLKVFRKSYASGADRMLKTILTDKSYSTERGQKEFNALFETREKVFQSPKSPFLIADLLATCTRDDDLILDFFAGSGTTGHATWLLNAADGGKRQYILVQLPEPLHDDDDNQRAAARLCDSIGRPRNIAEVTKERLRRAAGVIRAANPNVAMDMGFRVFKLDSSNVRSWDPSPAQLEQALVDSIEHVQADRTEGDLLCELSLMRGLDLCAPHASRWIAGATVWCVDGGALFACFATSIMRADVAVLADGIATWHAELAPAGDTAIVFLDAAFADDATKASLAAHLKQRGLTNVSTL
ncbi:MAG: site-specific DNA-methyltransferase [Gemmatimonadaceae bacterium]